MNINASNQSLINTLLQQASKSSEKKRPTFEEVFAKLNARTARMDANKNPINNILTNEQLFRYYIKETEPKLQISNDTFSGEELFNPTKESDPTKTYGSATTGTSDIAQLIDPANNLPVEGIAPPEVPSAPIVPRVPRAPAPPPSPYTQDQQQDIREAEMFIDSGNDFLEYFNNIDMASVNDETKEFLNIIFAKGIGDSDWGELGQYMFDRINNRLDESGLIADLFQVMTAFSAMPDGLTKYHIPRAIFKLTSPSNSFGGIEDYKAILEGSEIDLRKRFYNHRDTNGAGLREADGTYSRQSRAEGERQFDKYKLDKFDPIDAVSTFFIADNQARIDKIKTGKDFERYEGDPNWVNPRLLEVQQRRRLGDVGGIINDLLDDMFNDADTQLRTNTDINSTVLDPQIVDNIAGRSSFFGGLFGGKSQAQSSSDLSKATTAGATSASSTIAEAGSGGANIDDVVRRRGERGPDLLPRSRRTKAQIEAERLDLMGAQGGK
jgi:hypothetical protein